MNEVKIDDSIFLIATSDDRNIIKENKLPETNAVFYDWNTMNKEIYCIDGEEYIFDCNKFEYEFFVKKNTDFSIYNLLLSIEQKDNRRWFSFTGKFFIDPFFIKNNLEKLLEKDIIRKMN